MKKIKDRMRSKGINQIETTIKDSITKHVYEAYNPTDYKRTYRLRDSITLLESTETQTFLSYTFGHDASINKAMTNIENPPMGRARHKFGKGKDKSSYLPYMIHEGKFDDEKQIAPSSWYQPKPYMTKAREKVEQDILPKLLK